MKNCIVCGETLASHNWPTHAQDNYINKCKACINIEKKIAAKKFREANRELSISRVVNYKRKLKARDPVKHRALACYGDSRKRSVKHSWEFDLTSEFILELMRKQTHCPLLDCKLTYEGRCDSLASIDRIDSSRGYTKDNVQIISYLANLMKSSATREQLLSFAEGIMYFYRETK